jgi:hypothetical protein
MEGRVSQHNTNAGVDLWAMLRDEAGYINQLWRYALGQDLVGVHFMYY